MNQTELNRLLIKLGFLVLLLFTIFIIFVNFYKYFNYLIEIDRVIKQAQSEHPGEIKEIKNQYTDEMIQPGSMKQVFNLNQSYSAHALGYQDYLDFYTDIQWSKGINLLIIGSDKKNFLSEKSRADVIIVMRINHKGQILSISIPRDTLIQIYYDSQMKGHEDKIGHSLYWGGLDGLKKSVENLLDSPIYKTIVIDNFRTFEAFLAIVGGVRIDKELKGQLGIKWIRNRQFKLGDIDRCRRQQVFLKKAVHKLWQISKQGNIFYSSLFFDHFKKLVVTDLNKADFYNILFLLKTNHFAPRDDFYTCVLPGHFGEYDSLILNKKKLSCWILDKKNVELIRFLFYSEETGTAVLFKTGQLGYSDFIMWELKQSFSKIKNSLNGAIKSLARVDP